MTPDAFAAATCPLDAPDRRRSALRERGPVVRVDAPAGGPAWIVTDPALARQVLADPRIVKDPAHAPTWWTPLNSGIEPTAAEQPSLTTLDGADHGALRRAHAPLFAPRRILAHADRVAAIARELLAEASREDPVDLMADFTTRYPLTVLLDLLGAPLERVDQAAAACRTMFADDPGARGRAMAEFAEVAGSAIGSGSTADELGRRLPDTASASDLAYHLFALIFAGQLTTDAALGFVLARALAPGDGEPEDAGELVEATLRDHPPAPYTLWRFTAVEVELAGCTLAAGSPVLVDIQGVNGLPGPSLAFGTGRHACLGVHLARLELRTVVEVLRADFPRARLAEPRRTLTRAGAGDIGGERLTRLPVVLPRRRSLTGRA